MGDSNHLFSCRCHGNDRPGTKVLVCGADNSPVRPEEERGAVSGSNISQRSTSFVPKHLHNSSNIWCQLIGERYTVTIIFRLLAPYPLTISTVTQLFRISK